MIEIFPASKVLVDSLNAKEELLVCVRGEKGTVLFITELAKYLKARTRGRATAKPAHKGMATQCRRANHDHQLVQPKPARH